ncbi:C-type isolectin Sp-CL4-like [Sebastes fasciatus]|uniref:C-type isolectin Sp-CL4-like n=1 Tax=Sebastes fasciatus TaxID=394691 RepID=UPI003D9F1B25
MHPAVITAVLLLVGVLDAVTARPDTPPASEICESYEPAACGDGWIHMAKDRCVKYFETPKTFQEAQDECVSEGGGLVSMHNEGEVIEVLCLSYSASTDLKQFWIGAERSGEEFKYVDGSAFDYHQWHNGQPDNFGGDEDCVESNYEEWGMWNDNVCSKKKPFVCAKKL